MSCKISSKPFFIRCIFVNCIHTLAPLFFKKKIDVKLNKICKTKLYKPKNKRKSESIPFETKHAVIVHSKRMK